MAKKLSLKVADWSFARFVWVHKKSIRFEVTRLGCGCDSCYGRLRAVISRMEGEPIKWSVIPVVVSERPTPEPSIILVLRPNEMPEEPVGFLSNLLGLELSEEKSS